MNRWKFSNASCASGTDSNEYRYTEIAILMASAIKNTMKIFFRVSTGSRCARRAPYGATKKLVSAMPKNAGR